MSVRMRNPFARARSTAAGSEMQEMILLTLVRAAENATALAPVDLGRELNATKPALEIQLRVLLDQNLVTVMTTGHLALTTSGRERALTLLRRHRLAERLFTDVLGLDWVRAHVEADKIEHAVSPEAERQMAAQLGEPDTCPHGNPIPGPRHDSSAADTLSLDQCAPPARATISRIGLETPAALLHLATLGLLPNVAIEVENRAPFDGPVLVRVGRAHYALGRTLASRIWVRKSN